VLPDLDGVLYVEDEPIPDAVEVLGALRAQGLRLRFATNTTSRPRREILARLAHLGIPVAAAELATPAHLAVQHCLRAGRRRAFLLMTTACARISPAWRRSSATRTR
jgi:phospholysine phosphohistidine inorganic pyrophosphate phosphatase